MMSTLRMQFYMIIGQGVPEIQGVTDRQTDSVQDLLYRYHEKQIQTNQVVKLIDLYFFPTISRGSA